MLKKILATVSVAGIVAGAASALSVTPNTVANGQYPLLLAQELAYGSTTGIATSADNQLQFLVAPTNAAAVFPTGNILMRVEVANATFSRALNGSEVGVAGQRVVSSGGTSGSSVVTFLLSGAEACTQSAPCEVNLPLRLSGAGNVTASVGLQTDAGAPIDNSSLTELVTTTLVRLAPAFTIDIEADDVITQALLDDEDPFTELSADTQLGLISAGPTVLNLGTNAVPFYDTVARDIIGTAVNAGGVDIDRITVVASGAMQPFGPATTALPAGSFSIGGPATVSVAGGTATRVFTPVADAGIANQAVVVTENGVSTIARSAYSATVSIALATGSVLTAGASETGALQSITREGTEVTFPWTQSATQGEASGVTSVFRIGNLAEQETGAVFAEVRNSSEAGFTNGGIMQLTTSIDAGGEFVINSAQLEAALGNYGRGDVSFIIEADSDTLTGRQFVVRNGNVQNVIGGTIAQDQ